MPEHLRTIRVPLANGSVATLSLADERRIDSLAEQISRLSSQCSEANSAIRTIADKMEHDSEEMAVKLDCLAKALRRIALTGEFDSHLIKELLMAGAITPEEIAEIWPDIVAICEPDDGYFGLGPHSSNNWSPCSMMVQARDGVLRRDQFPEGLKTFRIYSADTVFYLNLKGFTRFAAKGLPAGENNAYDAELAKYEYPDEEHRIKLRRLSGCVNMGDLLTMPWTFRNSDDALEAIDGDWSGAENVTNWQGVFCCFLEGSSNLKRLPSKMNTAKGCCDQMFANCPGVEKFPEIDLSAQGPIHNLFHSYDNLYYPGTVHARARNLGAYSKNVVWVSFNLLKNWDYEDMVYSLVTASVRPQYRIRIELHSDALARLTAADKAAIVAKNFTLAATWN